MLSMRFLFNLQSFLDNKIVKFVIFILIIALLFVLIFYREVPKEATWIVKSGKKKITVYKSGFHFFCPFYHKIIKKINNNYQRCEYYYKDIHTKDDLHLDCQISLSYRVNDPLKYYNNKVTTIEEVVHDALEKVTDNYSKEEIYTFRDKISDELFVSINKDGAVIGSTFTQVNLYF